MHAPANLNGPPERYAFPVNEACLRLGISRTSLYQLVKSGELKVVKIAGRTLVPHSELDRLTRVDPDPEGGAA